MEVENYPFSAEKLLEEIFGSSEKETNTSEKSEDSSWIEQMVKFLYILRQNSGEYELF